MGYPYARVHIPTVQECWLAHTLGEVYCFPIQLKVEAFGWVGFWYGIRS